MEAVSPIVPGLPLEETVIAKDQPPYKPLPSFVSGDGYVLSRWKLSWKERFILFFRGNVYHWQGTFGHPMQPISMHVETPVTAKQADFYKARIAELTSCSKSKTSRRT